MHLKLGEYTSQLMESMWIMSQRECAVVAQKFKLTKIIVFQIRAIDFTHEMWEDRTGVEDSGYALCRAL